MFHNKKVLYKTEALLHMKTEPTVKEKAQAMAAQTQALMASAMLDLESRLLSKHKLTMKMACLLAYLARGNSPNMTEIHRSLGVSTAAITGCIDRLEKLGFVQRVHPPDDRRKVMVEITLKGKAFITEMNGFLEDIFVEAIINAGRPSLAAPNPQQVRKGPTLQIPLGAIMGAA